MHGPWRNGFAVAFLRKLVVGLLIHVDDYGRSKATPSVPNYTSLWFCPK